MSVDYCGRPGNFTAWYRSALSNDGTIVAFDSGSSNLVAADTNASRDIFVHDRSVPLGECLPKVSPEQTFGDECVSANTDHWILHAADPSGCLSDPVNTATGSFVTSAADISLPGIGIPFTVKRTYTSADPSQGPLGKGWTHNLSASLSTRANGDVVFRAESGQQLLFTLQPDGDYRPPAGGRSTLRSVAGGYEVTRQDQARYGFNDAGQLTAMHDRNGQGLSMTYGADGHLATVTDSGGRVITFTHDGGGLLTSVALSDGRSVSYGYTNGLLTSVTDLRGNVTTYEYSQGLLSKVTDPDGHDVVRNIYDASGRVIEQFDALGNKSTFSWDPASQTATMTDARGNKWKDVYIDNVLVKRVDPLGNVTRYTYDGNLNLIGVTDARGNTTSFSYDQSGNLLKKTSPAPLSYEETFAYDNQNNLLSHTDGRGNTTTYEYDAVGNLIKKIQPGAIVTSYGRDPNGTGLVTSVADSRGKLTRFDYDAAGNLVKRTSPSGAMNTMGYDSAGRLTSVVEPRGNKEGANPADYTTTYAYDAQDHLISTTDPLGNTIGRAYNPDGSLKSRTDAKNKTTSYAYDAAHRLTLATAPDNTTTSYSYDQTGNLISRTDAKNHITTYDYDAANRRTRITSHTDQIWTYSYDAAGNLVKTEDANGSASTTAGDGITTFGYDELNRLASINYSDATPNVSFAYDASSNRSSMTDGAGTETYAYDILNRLTKVIRGASIFEYGYDLGSNLTSRTNPDGSVVAYTYDDDSRLSTVTSGAWTATYGYDASGNLLTTTLPSSNGHVETRTYDRAGRLTEIINAKGSSVLSSAAYTLDAAGNPTVETFADGSKTTFSYDSLDRLAEACFQTVCSAPTDPFIRYTYDPVGNRTKEDRPESTMTYDYNASDELVSVSDGSTISTYDHDRSGNMTRAGDRIFTYDLANRMKRTEKGLDSVAYTYDGDGKRLSSSSGPSGAELPTIDYLWDPNAEVPQLVLEKDAISGSASRRYTYGHSLISMKTGEEEHFYHKDRLGSVTNVTDATGTPQWSYSYEPFGSSRTTTKINPLAPDNPMQFTGQYLDPTGLYHLRARQYDPTLSRFLQREPLPSLNVDPYVSAYVYVNNRPTLYVDPSGLVCILGSNPDGSCRGSGVFDTIADAAVATGRFVRDISCRSPVQDVADFYSVGNFPTFGNVITSGTFSVGKRVGAANPGSLAGKILTKGSLYLTVGATVVDVVCRPFDK